METGNITPATLLSATAECERANTYLADVLVSNGDVRAADFYRAFAQVQGLQFADLRVDPPDPLLLQRQDRSAYASLNLVPWRRMRTEVLIAVVQIDHRRREWATRKYGEGGFSFVITSPFDIIWTLQSAFREADDHVARNALFDRAPQQSARETITTHQALVGLGGVFFFLALVIAAPTLTLAITMAAVTAFYTATFLFKFVLTWVGASRRVDTNVSPERLATLSDSDLPTFTVLAPMYREAKVLPLLVHALRNLDYPQAKLEVMLVLEEGDSETINAAKALKMPGNFRIVRVPLSQPKTKPKACNYALQFAQGEYLTIYDGEDQPEPDQLKKAVLAFRDGAPELACVQARLNYFNRGENWLTRMFTLEYSQWFDFLLPGLHWLRMPIPLGGTSNHFKSAALREVGAWDPYNVTEDADLGVRFAQRGYSVGVINSTTFEEANGVLASWIKQRSRWVKGYMQTWLVHMRRPISLWRSIGWRGFVSFQLFVGAPVLVLLMNPIMWAIMLLTIAPFGASWAWLFPEPVGALATFNLIIANSALVYFGVIAALKRRYYDLVAAGVLQPLYWVLHSVAAYKALWQLIFKPHYWEKTEHGTSKATDAALARVAQAGA